MDRRERLGIWAAALILFVVGGAFGGWWYVAEHAVGEAQAQVTSNCGPGRDCTVKALTTTGPAQGAAGSSSKIYIGTLTGLGGAIWLGRNSPASEDWHIGSTSPNGMSTYLNSNAGSIYLRTGGINRLTLASETLTSAASAGVNAIAFSTNTARLDLGTGANDFMYSSGSNVNFAAPVQSDGFWSSGGTGVTVAGSAAAANDSVNIDSLFSTTLTTGRLLVLKNAGAEKGAFASNGALSISGVASGSNALSMVTGNRLDLGGGGSDYFRSDGTDIVAATSILAEGSPALKATGSGGVQIVGVATGSLPACGGGTSGLVHNDTTLNRVAHCDGSSYAYLGRTATGNVSSTFSNVCFGDCAELTEFSGGYTAAAAHVVQKVSCSWSAAGTASGGTDAVVFELRDETAGSTLCTCTLAADCTVAAGTVQSCDCSGTMTSGNDYELRAASASNCGSMPDNIVCNVRFVP